MQERIARALLAYTGALVSAVVSLDAAGGILGVCLFDTMFCAAHMRVEPGAAKVWMICNHPGGEKRVFPEEWRNFCCLHGLANGVPAALYLCSEYFPCRRIGLFTQGPSVL